MSAPAGVPTAVERVETAIYVVGRPFEHCLTSALIGGVGRDAAHVARQIEAGVRATHMARERSDHV